LAVEAVLGALYVNCQKGIVYCKILSDMGHPQPKTLVYCNNATAVGIANNTVKQQRSCSMEMRFFWVSDKCTQDIYTLSWHPGQENLAHTIHMVVHGTYTWKILHIFSQRLMHPAL
jgi:hypothetical protein